MKALLQSFIAWAESCCTWCGRLVSWLLILMTLATCLTILLANLFDFGWVWLQESVIYMHGILFMSASAYTLKTDDHVRIDVFYARQSERVRAWINLCGSLVLLLPTCIMIGWLSWDYVIASWRVWEGSGESGGLPALYLLKSFLLLFAALMSLQGLAIMARSYLVISSASEKSP